MMLHYLVLFILGPGAIANSCGQSQSFQLKCASFADKIHLPDVTVNLVEFVPGGTNVSLPDNPPSCGQTDQSISVDICRVAMAVATSNSSQITLEAWFPANYAGRFLSTGNGGLDGCIQYADVAYGTQFGFATVGANNGHNGTSGKPFFHHPEVVEDFAFRSMHTGVVVGKELTKLFYEEGYNKSYYLGCSTGGREGFKAVQDFPDDFDGVVAGSPAINFVNLIAWSAHFLPITGSPTSDKFVSSTLWGVVHNEIMRQCDGLDGAVDGVISDTSLCHPFFENLICPPGTTNTSTCLTGKQVRAVNQVFSPMYGPNNTLYYPRMQPGSEIEAYYIYYNGQPFPFSTQWYRYVVFNETNWDPYTWTIEDATIALAQNPYNIQTFNGNLSAFRDAGKKVLTYHGLADPIISSSDSKYYYSHVADTMNMAPDQLDDFYRFFTVGGMGHCGGGNAGGVNIGNTLANYAGPDPNDNVLMAMVRWVEEGIAPDTITGTQYVDGYGSAVEYKRKHCRYPRHNVYKGPPGQWRDENFWECVLY